MLFFAGDERLVTSLRGAKGDVCLPSLKCVFNPVWVRLVGSECDDIKLHGVVLILWVGQQIVLRTVNNVCLFRVIDHFRRVSVMVAFSVFDFKEYELLLLPLSHTNQIYFSSFTSIVLGNNMDVLSVKPLFSLLFFLLAYG